MKKQFFLLISGKWKSCDRAIYLELKYEERNYKPFENIIGKIPENKKYYKRIRLYNHINKNMVLSGIGLY